MAKDIEWFDRRLGRYYDKHFAKYEETCDIVWYTNEPSAKWIFDIVALGLRVILSCGETGPVQCVKKKLRRKKVGYNGS